MRPREILIGNFYRLKSSSNYGYLKAILVLNPKIRKNTNTFKVVECEHTVNKSDKFGFIRLFRLCDMIKDT